MVPMSPLRTAGSPLRYPYVASRSAVIRSGSSSPISLRPSFSSFGDFPCFDESRSGNTATNPSLASRSATVGSQSVRPKISWMTMTPGALSFRSGYAT